MKKYVVLGIGILLLLQTKLVLAKDTVYSLNKYKEEQLEYILNGYKDGKENGYVVAGTYTKEQEEKKDTQVLLMKYKRTGAVDWVYSYGKASEDEVYALAYTYDENHQVDGYLLVVEETSDDEVEMAPHFLKIDEEGKLKEEKNTTLDVTTKIHKVLETSDGYIITGSRNHNSFIAKYNENLDLVWDKNYEVESKKTILTDIIEVESGYYGIVLVEEDETKSYQLIKWDLEGNFLKVVKEDFEESDYPQLAKGKDFYIVYGMTQQVKLSDKKSGSFYLLKYDLEDNEVWETLGTTPVDEEKVLRLQINENEKTEEYFVLSTNKNDRSIEVIRVDSEGIIQNKVKKLKNDYYNIKDFIAKESTIYFIGQINCPEDDNCDYDANSLFLVSDEDTVIEVKDNDSKTILVAMTIMVMATVLAYVLRKRKRLEMQKETKK